MAAQAETPMMVQFRSLKAKHPDALLLFRCGDFYETYAEDAVTAAQILGITLTHRNNKNVSSVEMAGFPHHALDTYLPKLVRAGYRVAICDQLEDPKLAKKLVKRGITEVVTPGVALTDNVLVSKENNFLAALVEGRSTCGLALLDISTGEFAVAEGTADYMAKLLIHFSPKEILVTRGSKGRALSLYGQSYNFFEMEDWAFVEKTALERLCKHFKVRNMKGFGIAHMPSALIAAGVVLFYLDDTQHTHLEHITTITRLEEDGFVRLDSFTLRNLELIAPLAMGGRSLLQVIDRTLTPMGGRLLRRWITMPLCNVKDIQRRQACVDYFFQNTDFREGVTEQLQMIGDMERLVSKLSTKRILPRELVQLGVDLEAMKPIRDLCQKASQTSLRELGEHINPCEELSEHIRKTLDPNPPSMLSKGNYIAAGVNEQLDELRYISTSSKDYLLKLQQREVERTGISSLKIGFNNVFGYYLEVRNTFKDKVPEEWIRKQTLVGAERYITQELKDYEEKILGAQERILELESQIYASLLHEADQYITSILTSANWIAKLDCLLCFATTAAEHKYVRPEVDDSSVLDIRDGRHPVIETEMPAGERYVPNDILLDTEKQQIIVITGPNMAGKSALLRQTALIVLLAQAGSFVPASKAHIGLVDRIFTRVGASDNISAGESTFMVEMSEAAAIMNNFTSRSLILFDELGRGTSTYDGISIAWSIVEHLHENTKAHPRTLFATHYHELNDMANQFPRVHNYNVSVKEVGNQVVFLRKLVAGGSEHSFGIHVARMAGMPPLVVNRAEEVLADLEEAKSGNQVQPSLHPHREQAAPTVSLFDLEDPVLLQIRDRFLKMDINNLTPLEALNTLNDIRKMVTD